MSYRIAVVEDEADQRDLMVRLIRENLAKTDASFIVTPFSAALEVEDFDFDAYLLDIEMPGEDGIELARAIRNANSMAVIIFVSNIEQRVFEAIRVQPLRFIRKRQLAAELPEALAELRNVFRKQTGEKISLISNGVRFSLQASRILYIESQRKIQLIVMTEGRRELHSTMNEIESQLPDYFMRIQKSYIINLHAITAIDKGLVLMDNGVSLPVGRSKLGEVKKRFEEIICR